MASLESSNRKRIIVGRITTIGILFLLDIFLLSYLSAYMTMILTKKNLAIELSYIEGIRMIFTEPKVREIYLLIQVIFVLVVIWAIINPIDGLKSGNTMKITDDIEIPIAVGKGEFGTARFLTEKEKKKEFTQITYVKNKKYNETPGIVLQLEKHKNCEKLLVYNENKHVFILGSTRSGKTRRLLLTSIFYMLKSKKKHSMIIPDVKGEIYAYTSDEAKKEGFNVITFDLVEHYKSQCINFMQSILDALKAKDESLAIEYTWDLVDMLVGERQGEPIWKNGESATIAAAILIVAMESGSDVYKNLTNTYYFLAYMCKSYFDDNGNENMPLNKYLERLPDDHPGKIVFQMAAIAPERTRGSYFTSALGTLKNFANPNIANMTSKSDYNFQDIGKKPTIVYMIIPDEKKTNYELASLYLHQSYTQLVKLARENGGKLPVPVDYLLEEFGNFPKIPAMGNLLSAGAGRGIRAYMIIQSQDQVGKIYEKELQNIKNNVELTIYLKSTEEQTLKSLSDRMGTYTIQTKSVNTGKSGHFLQSMGQDNISVSDNANMGGRPLLYPSEIARIKTPYSLVFKDGKQAVMYSPDLLEYEANNELGLGSEEENQRKFIEVHSRRKERAKEPIKIWKVWEKYQPSTANLEDLENYYADESFLNI